MKIKLDAIFKIEDKTNVEKLMAALVAQQAEFERQLIPNLDYIDPRAMNDNGITLQEVVHIQGNQYALQYRYDWFVFSPCTNLDETGTHQNKVTFSLKPAGEICFDLSALGNEASSF
ncbi:MULTISPECIES: hypothetical protein [Vibrio]|uniref:Uncharacterized protein n=1 Tax=Vibrio algicola TaxID=2662262 RepID=A0A5Q0TCK6_9VIBR|nr:MULTISPECIES: hypothetical protein [Vibrio]MBD1577594.1 hypothetical protein [Vibrio sp. S11_S32]